MDNREGGCRHFQASIALSPAEVAGGLWTPASQPRQGFRFAVGVSLNPILSLAVAECVSAVRAKLGVDAKPDFCSLAVSTEPYGSRIASAPAVSSAS